MKLKLFLIIAIVFSVATARGQYENTTGGRGNTKTQPRNAVSPLSKLYVGGNIGGGWSNTSAFFQLSPIIGYRVTPAMDIGTRITYIYSKYKSYGYSYSYNDFGASIFTRYHLFNFIFVQAEFEELSAQYYTIDGTKSRRWVPGLFLGGGIYQHVGATFLHVGILYNLLDTQYSPYSNPLIRIGFGVGL